MNTQSRCSTEMRTRTVPMEHARCVHHSTENLHLQGLQSPGALAPAPLVSGPISTPEGPLAVRQVVAEVPLVHVAARMLTHPTACTPTQKHPSCSDSPSAWHCDAALCIVTYDCSRSCQLGHMHA